MGFLNSRIRLWKGCMPDTKHFFFLIFYNKLCADNVVLLYQFCDHKLQCFCLEILVATLTHRMVFLN